MAGRIETRRSDGLWALRPGEAETGVAAGMGGGLVIRILENSRCHGSMKEFILQPQSEIQELEPFLCGRALVYPEKIWWRRMESFIL